jgi:hypothetical protein
MPSLSKLNVNDLRASELCRRLRHTVRAVSREAAGGKNDQGPKQAAVMPEAGEGGKKSMPKRRTIRYRDTIFIWFIHLDHRLNR